MIVVPILESAKTTASVGEAAPLMHAATMAESGGIPLSPMTAVPRVFPPGSQKPEGRHRIYSVPRQGGAHRFAGVLTISPDFVRFVESMAFQTS
jgi:hypothetical protein